MIHKENKMIIIDLQGPNGNAFYLLGLVKKFGKQLDMTNEEIDNVLDEMKSSNYEDLIETFENYFGEFVVLQNKPFDYGFDDDDYDKYDKLYEDEIWDDETDEENEIWDKILD